MNTLTTTFAPLTRIRASLERLAGPQSMLCSIILLIARAYLFYVFFRSGLTKLHDWDTTVLLFTEEYKVPLLPFLLEGVALQPGMMQADGLHPTAQAQPKVLDNVWPLLRPLL